MAQLQIKALFKQRYDQGNWKQFLGETFANTQLFSVPETLVNIDHSVAANVQRLGQIILNQDEIERQIAIYEVTLAPGIVLERNRVGLRNLLRKYWKDIDAAFIVYHHTDKNNWRFTYVSELTGYDASGEFVEIKTEPKRYTYLLGEDQSVRTAVDRFQKIRDKGNKLSLDDVKEAFSVEKLSKIFFDEYKSHYKKFCDYMIAQPGISQTIFNGDEKAIRDFNKKLLGRIVFLYFIQKKGWLGVPVGENWGKGDFNFLTRQFQDFKHKDLFYKDFLSGLFFDTLNTKRQNDLVELVKNQPCRIPYLNGGLFEEENKNYRNLIFSSSLFEGLFNFFDQYNFTIYEDDPNDHTIAVDPEMLGHIFENLLEDNKDKGAYYTPKEIVHYMCQESLIEYLTTWFENRGYEIIGYASLGKTNEPQLFPINEMRTGQLEIEILIETPSKNIDRILIEKLLKKALDDQDKALVQKHSTEFHLALDSVKICDPAIGSGAFPMGLLHEIFTAKQTLHSFKFGNTKTFDASAVKLNIIQNSIYGVDIERGAVDIARLRFWLSLIVDEDQPKALPNLDYKIVVGNSLVSKLNDEVINIDWNIDETAHGLFGQEFVKKKGVLLNQISQFQKAFFSPDSNKKKLTIDIRNLKIDLLINQLELMIRTQGQETEPKAIDFKDKKKFVRTTELYYETLGWKSTIKRLKVLKTEPESSLNFFDWKLDFPEVMNGKVVENVGFDIVIGNPPYGVSIKGEYRDNVLQLLGKVPDFEIYYYFIELAKNILKINGVKLYIIPNTFLFNVFASDYRKKLLENWQLNIIDCTAFKIFDGATVYNAITIFSNTSSGGYMKYKLTRYATSFQDLIKNKDEVISVDEILKNNQNWSLIFKLEKNILNLLIKIKSKSKKLSEYFPEFSQGLIAYDKYKGQAKETIKNRIFHFSTKTKPSLKKWLWGSDVTKYSVKWNKQEWINYCPEIANPRNPKFFKNERILIREITNPSIFCGYTNEELYHDPSIIVILNSNSYNIKILLAILNSKLATFYHFNSSPKATKGAFPKILVNDIKNFPLPLINNKNIFH